jgi:hypothetical protein
MLTEENLVSGLATELVDEAVGASSRKWAIFLVALVLGAAIALWLVRRSSGGEEEIASEVTPVPSTPSGAAAGG